MDGMGRPPLPPSQRAAHTVGVRLSAPDHAALVALVGLPGAPAGDASGLLRELLRREARAHGLLPPDPAAPHPGLGESSSPSPPAAAPPAMASAPSGGTSPSPLPAAMPTLPLAGLLPAGALLLVWPPGWPLPVPPPYQGPTPGGESRALPWAPPSAPQAAPIERAAGVPNAESRPSSTPTGPVASPVATSKAALAPPRDVSAAMTGPLVASSRTAADQDQPSTQDPPATGDISPCLCDDHHRPDAGAEGRAGQSEGQLDAPKGLRTGG